MSLVALFAAFSVAGTCPEGALGGGRVIELDASAGAEIGTMQYAETLDLAPGELVFTFDDGPSEAHTLDILDTLDAHCVTAVFFLVGIFAERRPDLVREIHRRGHVIANHSHTHANLSRLGESGGLREVDRGFAAIDAALAGEIFADGRPARAARIFRFPGLNHSTALRRRLAESGVSVWSCDIGTDDWRRISAAAVRARALANIEAQGRGVIIMHDTQARTAEALPGLLADLAARGYRTVTVRELP